MNQYVKLLVIAAGAVTVGASSLPTFAATPTLSGTVILKPIGSGPKPMTLPPQY
jgi:hypothetical protein